MPYFYNTQTQESVWDAPKDLTEEEIKALPGAEHLRPEKVRASHILVKHSGSRRPSSWKEVSRRSFVHLPTVTSSPSSISLFSVTKHRFLVAQNHTLEGRGHRDLGGIQNEDRGERRQVWPARTRALRLFLPRSQRRPGLVRTWADAEAVRGCGVLSAGG